MIHTNRFFAVLKRIIAAFLTLTGKSLPLLIDYYMQSSSIKSGCFFSFAALLLPVNYYIPE